jgi:hypothetical protein
LDAPGSPRWNGMTFAAAALAVRMVCEGPKKLL